MDFSLNEEQRAWQLKARQFAEEEIRPISLERDQVADAAQTLDWDVIRKGSRVGLRTAAVAKEWGGHGIDFVTQAVVIAELAEKRLWSAADNLRANSNYASNEYFMPLMGLIFLRHAYSRYLAVKDGIEANLPERGGKARPLTKEDFSQKGSIYLRPKAQFDYLVSLPDSANRARAIQHAMESIEEDYADLKGGAAAGRVRRTRQ